MIGVRDWDELYAVGGVAPAAADVNSYRLTNIAIIESVSRTMKMATSYSRMDKFCTANVLVVMLNFPFESRCINFAFCLMVHSFLVSIASCMILSDLKANVFLKQFLVST